MTSMSMGMGRAIFGEPQEYRGEVREWVYLVTCGQETVLCKEAAGSLIRIKVSLHPRVQEQIRRVVAESLIDPEYHDVDGMIALRVGVILRADGSLKALEGCTKRIEVAEITEPKAEPRSSYIFAPYVPMHLTPTPLEQGGPADYLEGSALYRRPSLQDVIARTSAEVRAKRDVAHFAVGVDMQRDAGEPAGDPGSEDESGIGLPF